MAVSGGTALGITGGLNLLSGMFQFAADSAKAKAQKKMQDYTNRMVDLSNSVQQNVVATNQILAENSFAEQALELQTSTMQTAAATEVSAAAAGVKGRSVNMSVLNVMRNAAKRESDRQQEIMASTLAFNQSRVSAAMGAAMQKDYSYIPKPSALGTLLGVTTSTVSTGLQNKWI